MVRISLTRFAYLDDVTLGRLYHPAGWCYTLEDPWLDNRVGVSCIPENSYGIMRGTFQGRYANFELVHVTGRTAIEMHRGNSVADTRGCILLGKALTIDGQPLLRHSKDAFDTFMEGMHGIDESVLVVTSQWRSARLPVTGGE